MDNQSPKQSSASGLGPARDRVHGRTLSVPSISTSEHFSSRPSSPAPPSSTTLGPPQVSNNMYLSPNAEGSGHWPNTGLRLGSSGGPVRSRSASTSSLTIPQSTQTVKKRIVTACQRCRTRKIKCDGVLPCCGNCAKAGQICMEVDKSGERDIPRSHVLELENRIKYLEELLSSKCPDLEVSELGPPVELRTRPAPPAIRIVTSGPNLHPSSSSHESSSPISAVSTPASFDFSPGSNLMPYSPAFSPYSFSEPPGSAMPSPMLSPACSPFPSADHGLGGPQSGGTFGGEGHSRRNSMVGGFRSDHNRTYGNSTAQDVGLVALGLTEDTSRYIGASSGFEFARMLFADCPPLDTNTGDRATTSTDGIEEGRAFLRRRSSSGLSAHGVTLSNVSTQGDSTAGSNTPSANTQSRSRRVSVSESPERKRGRWTDSHKSSPLPSSDAESHQFTTTFFDTVNLHYPFLERHTLEACRDVVYSSEKGASTSLTNMRTPSIPILPPNHTLQSARFQVFMVFAIGSSILAARLGQKPSADSMGYFVSAMSHVENDEVKLRGSIQGLQNMLLLAMYALHVDGGGGLNIWHLNSAIVAGSVELGLHKNAVVNFTDSTRTVPSAAESSLVLLRRKVFWSVYALDRDLGIMLGRPFALDESECDVELPANLVEDRPTPLMDRLTVPTTGANAMPSPGEAGVPDGNSGQYSGTVCLLHMIRITSIIKNTLYRIGTIKPIGYPTPTWLPSPFPSPPAAYVDDISEWQGIIHRYLEDLRESSKTQISTTSSNSFAISQAIELKYHEAIQLLYRPTPVIPQPTNQNSLTCLNSTIETIRLYCKLRKLGAMNHAYLSAQWVFLSGLSMMWCFKQTWPTILSTPGRKEQKIETLKEDIKSCSELLEDFGKRWRVMQRAKERFDGVARLTLEILMTQTVQQQQPHLTVSGPLAATSAKLLIPSQHIQIKHQHQHQQGLPPRTPTSPSPQRTKTELGVQIQLQQPEQLQALATPQTMELLNPSCGNGLPADQAPQLMFSQPQEFYPPRPSNQNTLHVPDQNWLLVTPPTQNLTLMQHTTPNTLLQIPEPQENTPQGQLQGSAEGQEELDYSWVADMDWASPDLLNFSLTAGGVQSLAPTSVMGLEGFNEPGIGGMMENGGDSAMWGMGTTNEEQ